MDIKTFISEFASKTKTFIAVEEKFKELSGAEKKAELDTKITNWAQGALDTLPVNLIAKWVLKNVIIKNIPAITQAVFDLIETRINGITKEAE